LEDYGKELILDLHKCNPVKFTRKEITNYFKQVCTLIDMKRCKLVFWDDHGVPLQDQQTKPHLKGTSAVQFILTSNITIHTLDILKRVYLNVFSCKNFDEKVVIDFSEKWFKGRIINKQIIRRI